MKTETITVFESERSDSFHPYKIYVATICRDDDNSITVEGEMLPEVLTEVALILENEEANA